MTSPDADEYVDDGDGDGDGDDENEIGHKYRVWQLVHTTGGWEVRFTPMINLYSELIIIIFHYHHHHRRLFYHNNGLSGWQYGRNQVERTQRSSDVSRHPPRHRHRHRHHRHRRHGHCHHRRRHHHII